MSSRAWILGLILCVTIHVFEGRREGAMFEAGKRGGRFVVIKGIACKLLYHPLIGTLIAKIFKNRIRSNGDYIRIPPNGDPRIAAMLYWGGYESAEIRFVR